MNDTQVKQETFSKEFVQHVIDRFIPFEDLLQSKYSIVPSGLGVNGSGSCFCPFHDNTDTRAAKLYQDDDGERIFCFAENRMYRPHDLLTCGLVEIDPKALFSLIWKSLNVTDRDDIISKAGTQAKNFERHDFSVLHDGYMKGELCLKDVVYAMLDYDKFPLIRNSK